MVRRDPKKLSTVSVVVPSMDVRTAPEVWMRARDGGVMGVASWALMSMSCALTGVALRSKRPKIVGLEVEVGVEVEVTEADMAIIATCSVDDAREAGVE